MIKQLTVRNTFEGTQEQGSSRGFTGFPLKAFPVGHVLNVDSPLVVLIGDNGAGKSTFLDKIETQFNAGGDEHWYFDPVYDRYGIPDDVHECNLAFDREQNWETGETRSHGEYKLQRIPELLKAAKKYPKKDILFFDEPENGVSLRNKGRLVRMIADYAFKEQRQIFVATHEPEFLKVRDARVINLDAHPAASYLAQDFDIRSYMSQD